VSKIPVSRGGRKEEKRAKIIDQFEVFNQSMAKAVKASISIAISSRSFSLRGLRVKQLRLYPPSTSSRMSRSVRL
jgi:hypothetical protein